MNKVSEETVCDLLYEIDREIYEMEINYFEMENEAGRSEVDKIVAKRKKETAQKAKSIVQQYMSKISRGIWLSKCCDSKLRYFPLEGKQCKDCKEKNPDTYNVDCSVHDLIDSSESENSQESEVDNQ